MGNFSGGSAFSMAQQIADGYLLVTERTFKRLAPGELQKLLFELDRLLRSIRAASRPMAETLEIQKRNRRIQRLNSTRMMLQTHRQTRRR
jgi:hypothetical protein